MKGKNKTKQVAMPIRLQEFEFGSYVEAPGTALAENQIAIAAAKDKASRNPFALGTQILGNLAMSYGGSMMNKARSQGQGVSQGGFDWGSLLSGGVGALGTLGNTGSLFATGGKVGVPTPINAEGNEVIETPQGSVGVLKGPSHSEGGIDMVVPSGTEIFSQKLKGDDGNTMAQRKINREKEVARLQKILDKNPGDIMAKKTLQRIQSNNEKVESKDMAVMQMAKMLSDMQSFATGGVAGTDPFFPEIDLSPYILPQQSNPYIPDDLYKIEDFGGGPVDPNLINPQPTPTGTNTDTDTFGNNLGNIFDLTAGDITGLFGDLVSTFGPMRNTNRSRATDTPNINPYANYGKNALNTLDSSKQFAAGVRDNQLQDLELSRNAAISRGRNSARGINTLRSLDLAIDMGVNNTRSQVYNQYASQIASILGQQAGMQMQQDQVVMTGEGQRDQANRADKDAYFTALATDIATKGTGLQKIGRDLNQVKSRNVTGNVLNQMYPNFEVDLMSGAITGKVTEDQVKSTSVYSNLPTKELQDKYLNGILKKNYSWKEGKLYNKQGKEIDPVTLEPVQ